MRLTDEELQDVLSRAEEIQRATRHGPEWNSEVAAVISAAEEVGFSRRAVERALSERLNLPTALRCAFLAEVSTISRWISFGPARSYLVSASSLIGRGGDPGRVRSLHMMPQKSA